MPETVKQKVTDLICKMIEHNNRAADPYNYYIVVRRHRLRLVRTSELNTGDIYVLKCQDDEGTNRSRLDVARCVNILHSHIGLTSLLTPRKQKGKP